MDNLGPKITAWAVFLGLILAAQFTLITTTDGYLLLLLICPLIGSQLNKWVDKSMDRYHDWFMKQIDQ